MSTLITLDKLEDLRKLSALYEGDWPRNALGYYTLDNFINWFKRESPPKHVAVYTLAEEWQQNGLFIIKDRFQLFVNTLNTPTSSSSLTKALTMLDWQRGYKITTIPDKQLTAVMQAIALSNAKWRGVTLNLYRLPKERALNIQINCPSGFTLRPLNPADARIVDDLWYSRQPGTLQFIERLIANNISVGLYLCDSDELVAWCIRCPCGLLGMLHVKQAFRRRGLAELLCCAFMQQVAETGDDVLTIVSEQNHASNALFRKLNFQLIDVVHHRIATRVENEKNLWDETMECGLDKSSYKINKNAQY